MTPTELTTTIERLIDDELTVAEERSLLRYLDANPAHWRACALAFVEHRALARGARSWLLQSTSDAARAPLAATIAAALNAGESTPAIATAPSSQVPRSQALAWEREPCVDVELDSAPATENRLSAAPSALAIPGRRNRRGEWLTIAAGLGVAFALGGTIREYWPHGELSAGPGPSIAQTQPTPKKSSLPNSGQDEAVGAPSQFASTPVPENLRLHMVSDGAQTEQTVDVPLLPMERVDDSILQGWQQAESPASLPQDILKSLEQEGHVVRQQKSWLQVELPDGRRALIPVERVIVRPATQ